MSNSENLNGEEFISSNAKIMKSRLEGADEDTLITIETHVYDALLHRADRFNKYLEILKEDEELERLYEEKGIVSIEDKKYDKLVRQEVSNIMNKMGIDEDF